MEKREKIKQIYRKLNVKIGEDYLEGIMNNPQRVDSLMRMYKDEEINSMNEIFDKDDNNKYFTKEELEFIKDIDLFDRPSIKVAKMIWKQKDNPQMLNNFLIIAKKELAEDDIKLIKSLQEKEVIANVSNH